MPTVKEKMVEEQHRITTDILKKSVAAEFSTSAEQVQILSFDVTEGSAAGDNFATVVKLVDFKFQIGNGEEKCHTYIVKQVPFQEMREKLVKAVRINMASAWLGVSS